MRERLLKAGKLDTPQVGQFASEVWELVERKCEGNALLSLQFAFSLLTSGCLEVDAGGVARLADEAKESDELDDWRRVPAPMLATQQLGEQVDTIQRKGGVRLVLLLKAAAVLGEMFTSEQLVDAYPGKKEGAEGLARMLGRLEDPGELAEHVPIEIMDESLEHGLLVRFLRPFLKEVIYQRMLFAEQRKPLHTLAASYIQTRASLEEGEQECKRLVRHILAAEDLRSERELGARAKQSVNIMRVQTLVRAGQKVIKRGLLTKEGGKAGKNIETRYVILTQSEFQYFHSEEESMRIRHPLGTIIL